MFFAEAPDAIAAVALRDDDLVALDLRGHVDGRQQRRRASRNRRGFFDRFGRFSG